VSEEQNLPQDEELPIEEGQLEVDAVRLNALVERYRNEQQLGPGFLAGLGAALLGAVLWALVTVVTGYQIGFMAVGIGFLVGIAVRRLGKGIDTVFGVLSASLSLLGCLFGNLLAVCGLVAKQESIPFMAVLTGLDLGLAVELMKATFSPFDLLFYGIAVYEGYKLAFRRISQEELLDLAREPD
jgi:hypothetical protein